MNDMTAPTPHTIGNAPLAGLVQGAVTTAKGTGEPQIGKGAVFSEVLDALPVIPSVVETPKGVDVEKGAEQLIDHSSTDSLTDGENSDLVGDVDDTIPEQTFKVDDVPPEVEQDLVVPQSKESGNVQVLDDPMRERSAFEFVNSVDPAGEENRTLIVDGHGDHDLRARSEEIETASVHVSPAPTFDHAEIALPEVDTLAPLISHPIGEGRIDPAASEDELPISTSLVDGLVGRSFDRLQTVEHERVTPKPEFEVFTPGTAMRREIDDAIDLVSQPITQTTATVMATPTDSVTVAKLSDEIKSNMMVMRQHVDQRNILDKEALTMTTDDVERRIETSEIKVTPINSAAQQPTFPTATLVASQDAYKLDLGLSALGSQEQGYAEVSKLESTSISSSTSPVTPAATAQQAAQQIVRVAQAQPGGPVELALNPEELGRVKLTFASHENTLVVSIVGERAETIELMRRHIDSLSQEFKNIGYSDVSFNFSQGSGDGSSEEGASDSAAQLSCGTGDGASDLELSDESNVQEILSQTGLDIRI